MKAGVVSNLFVSRQLITLQAVGTHSIVFECISSAASAHPRALRPGACLWEVTSYHILLFVV